MVMMMVRMMVRIRRGKMESIMRVIRRMILSRMMIINKTMLNMIMMTF